MKKIIVILCILLFLVIGYMGYTNTSPGSFIADQYTLEPDQEKIIQSGGMNSVFVVRNSFEGELKLLAPDSIQFTEVYAIYKDFLGREWIRFVGGKIGERTNHTLNLHNISILGIWKPTGWIAVVASPNLLNSYKIIATNK